MMNDHIENQPLLYIVQPEFPPVTTKMQDSFRCNYQTKEIETSPIQETIDELLDLPNEIPTMTCEITTEHSIYEGRVVSQDEKSIQVILTNQEKTNIEKKDIQSIHYISF